MNLRRNALCASALVLLLACGNKNKDDEDTPTTSTPKQTSTTATPPPTAATSTQVKVEEPPGNKVAGVEAHVKAELDGRADGITGTTATAGGATLQTPTGWKSTAGAVTVVTAADDKARLGLTTFTGDPAAQLTAAATAMGLTNCQWNTPAEAIVSGKDKLAATGADGVCSRGAGQAHAAYIAPTAQGSLVVGAWDAGGDMTNVFGSMRSIAKGATGDGTGIAACCAALRQNAKSAPPQQQGAYLLAAGACDAVKNNPQGRAALGTVRAALAGASVPSTCK